MRGGTAHRATMAALLTGGALLLSAGGAGASPVTPPSATGAAHHAAPSAAARTKAARAKAARAKAAKRKAAKVRKLLAQRRARASQLRTLRTLSGRYAVVQRRAVGCARIAGVLRSTNAVRTAALKGTRKVTPAQLRARQTRLYAATVRLSRAVAGCTVTPKPAAPGATVPGTGAPAPTAPTATTPPVAAPPAPGPAPGPAPDPGPSGPGDGGGTTPPPGADPPPPPPPPAPGLVQSLLAPGGVLAALPIDLSGTVGTTLPAVIKLVPLAGLTAPACDLTGVLCLGLDPAAIGTTLSGIVGSVPLLGLVLQPLLTPVLAVLNGPSLDPATLFSVVDLGGGVLQLVPAGTLATLLSTVATLVGPLATLVGPATPTLGIAQVLQ